MDGVHGENARDAGDASFYARRVDGFVEEVREQLRSVFAHRRVIFAGGVAASAVQPIEQLRALGAGPFLVLSTGAGTGSQPDGPDVEVLAPFVDDGTPVDMIATFRHEERMIASPSNAVVDVVDRFDPRRDAITLLPMFLDVRALGARAAFGPRRLEWVALEDKTIADEMFDAAGVTRPPAQIVAADAASIDGAASALDRGAGTVWSADSRDGFNGGGSYVRWVRDSTDRDEALARLIPKSDRVRIAEFVDGVPCSIHGFVVDDGVAVFRPVELVTLRAPTAPRLRYCGCATFFDPPAAAHEAMRTAARRMGEYLRASVGFRGAFTVDGIALRDGWVATECNPRFGAGLGYVADTLPELCLALLHGAVVEGAADVASAELERYVVAAGAETRWGGAWTNVARRFDETSSWALVGDAAGYRFAEPDETAEAVLEAGPARGGGFVRVRFDVARTPSGPSIAPRAAAALACADRELELGIGPLAPAVRG
jgi:hypothetical protein